MDGDVTIATEGEAVEQVNYHLDRAQEAAHKLEGKVAAKVRQHILLAALEMTNY